MTRAREASPPACPADRDAVPGCDTGPAGRVAFVARELADLWRELRGHARPTPDPKIGTEESPWGF